MTKNSRQSFRLLLTRQYAISFLLLLLILGGVTYFSLYQCLLQNLDHGILLIAQSEADFATRNAALHLHRTRNVLPGVQSQYLSRYVEILTISGNLVVSNHFSKISLEKPLKISKILHIFSPPPEKVPERRFFFAPVPTPSLFQNYR